MWLWTKIHGISHVIRRWISSSSWLVMYSTMFKSCQFKYQFHRGISSNATLVRCYQAINMISNYQKHRVTRCSSICVNQIVPVSTISHQNPEFSHFDMLFRKKNILLFASNNKQKNCPETKRKHRNIVAILPNLFSTTTTIKKIVQNLDRLNDNSHSMIININIAWIAWIQLIRSPAEETKTVRSQHGVRHSHSTNYRIAQWKCLLVIWQSYGPQNTLYNSYDIHAHELEHSVCAICPHLFLTVWPNRQTLSHMLFSLFIFDVIAGIAFNFNVFMLCHITTCLWILKSKEMERVSEREWERTKRKTIEPFLGWQKIRSGKYFQKQKNMCLSLWQNDW